ncbi:VOC family protein [Brucella pseudogrignonensis]|uniref:VOC family protein n=1 Tax=Brucella pseudogrignonensis TaxID=419475 RepID=UPI003D971F7E
MTHPVRGVDHVFLLVNDLDKSAEQYRRLGFTLSPRGLHSKEKGTGNYTIMFPDDYFELLGIVAETEGNLHQREKLSAQGEGLHAIACRIENAQQAKSELAALGIQTGEVGKFSRPVELPDGSKGVAAFETVSFAEGEVPQGMVFMCQHKTRDTVWVPELLKHANGANGLAAIIAISADPAKSAEGFARLYADGKATESSGEWTVSTGPNSADISVLTSAQAQKLYPDVDFSKTPSGAFAALRIRVSALDAVRKVLDDNDLAYVNTSAGIAVLPENANGTVLEFVEV